MKNLICFCLLMVGISSFGQGVVPVVSLPVAQALQSSVAAQGSNAIINLGGDLSGAATNAFNSATNFAATQGSNYVSATTNIIGISGAGSGNANGTYLIGTANLWTNVNNPVWSILLSAGTWSVLSNSVTYYSSGTIPSYPSIINGVVPSPLMSFGRYDNDNGQIHTGLFSSTNLVGHIVAIVQQYTNGLATTNFVISYVGTATNGLVTSNTVQGMINAYIGDPTNGVSTNDSHVMSWTNQANVYAGTLIGSNNSVQITNLVSQTITNSGQIVSGNSYIDGTGFKQIDSGNYESGIGNKDGSFFLGGNSNGIIDSGAGSFQYSVIAAGQSNVLSGAGYNGRGDVILGGSFNNIGDQNDGSHVDGAVILGGVSNVVNHAYSLAGGVAAQALNANALVWNDGSAGTLASSLDHAWFVNTSNGMHFSGANVGPFVNGTNIWPILSTISSGATIAQLTAGTNASAAALIAGTNAALGGALAALSASVVVTNALLATNGNGQFLTGINAANLVGYTGFSSVILTNYVWVYGAGSAPANGVYKYNATIGYLTNTLANGWEIGYVGVNQWVILPIGGAQAYTNYSSGGFYDVYGFQGGWGTPIIGIPANQTGTNPAPNVSFGGYSFYLTGSSSSPGGYVTNYISTNGVTIGQFKGSFVGDGSGLTNLNAAQIGAVGTNVINPATNGQVLNTGSWFVGQNIWVSILQTNGGTLNIFGAGNITNNTYAMGAMQNITCANYCTNGGFTGCNVFTNEWQSCTSSIVANVVDFRCIGTNGITAYWTQTTNQSDQYNISALQRFNYWSLETPSGPAGHLNQYSRFSVPQVHWDTPYMYSGNCGNGTPQTSPTINIIDGSYIKADVWDNGPANPQGISWELFVNPISDTCYITLDVGSIIYSGSPFGSQWTYSFVTPSNTIISTATGTNWLYLARCTQDNSQPASYFGQGDLANSMINGLVGSWFDVASTNFYQERTNFISSFGLVTAQKFTGSGSGLTSLNANQLTGTEPLSVVNSAVLTNGPTGVMVSNNAVNQVTILANTNTYAQVVINNQSSGGSSSGGFVVQANNGSDGSYFSEFGLNGSGFTNTTLPPAGTNMAYWLVMGTSNNAAAAITNTASASIYVMQTNSVLNISVGNGGTQTNLFINSNSVTAGAGVSFTGNGGGLTNLNASQLTGTIPNTSLPPIEREYDLSIQNAQIPGGSFGWFPVNGSAIAPTVAAVNSAGVWFQMSPGFYDTNTFYFQYSSTSILTTTNIIVNAYTNNGVGGSSGLWWTRTFFGPLSNGVPVMFTNWPINQALSQSLFCVYSITNNSGQNFVASYAQSKLTWHQNTNNFVQ